MGDQMFAYLLFQTMSSGGVIDRYKAGDPMARPYDFRLWEWWVR